MTRGAMSSPVAATVIRFMVGTNRIIRTDRGARKRASQNLCESRCRPDQSAEGALGSRSGRVDKYAASIRGAQRNGAKGIYAFL